MTGIRCDVLFTILNPLKLVKFEARGSDHVIQENQVRSALAKLQGLRIDEDITLQNTS